jgi:hypothetical protein
MTQTMTVQQARRDGYHVFLGQGDDLTILNDGDLVECRWPDGSTSTHPVKVQSRKVHIDHIGRTRFDDWTEHSRQEVATIQVDYRGLNLQINLASKTEAPECRLLQKAKKKAG